MLSCLAGFSNSFAGFLAKWFNDPNAVFASCVAAFTFALVLVSNKQAKLTREALIATERAFVFLQEFYTDSPIHFDPVRSSMIGLERFIIKPLWRNNGTTPTKNMKVRVHWTSHQGELPDDFEYYYVNPASQMFLAPQATEWSAAIDVPNTTADAAMRDLLHLYVWGRVDYEDIFEGTRPHFTQWCYRIHITNNGVGNISSQYVAYGNYNNSDEDSRR